MFADAVDLLTRELRSSKKVQLVLTVLYIQTDSSTVRMFIPLLGACRTYHTPWLVSPADEKAQILRPRSLIFADPPLDAALGPSQAG